MPWIYIGSILGKMKKNKTKAKIAVILGSLFLYGCNTSENVDVPDINPPTVEIEEPVVEVQKKMTYEEFASEVVFKDGDGVEAETEFSIESGNGIELVDLKVLYEESNGDIEVLNEKIEELKEVYKVVPEEATEVESFHDSLHLAGAEEEDAFLEYLKNIKLDGLDEDEFYKTHYALNLAGRYDDAKDLRAEYCPTIECRTVTVSIKGSVTSGGRNLEGVKVRLLNDDGVESTTKGDGKYEFEYEVIYPNKLRFSASKSGYSTGFGDDYLLFETEPEEGYGVNLDFKLIESDGSVSLSGGEASGARGVRVNKKDDGSFQIELNSGEASFNVKDFVDVSGNKVEDNIVVDVFYFSVSEESEIQDMFLNIDVLGDEVAVLGNQFLTFGMPFIDIKNSETGEPVYIRKNNPAKVEFNLRGGEVDGVTRDAKDFFSEENWNKMIELSVNSDEDFPLDDVVLKDLFDGLGTLEGLYPIWWQLNYNTGIWEPAGFKILDRDGQKAHGIVYQID